MKPCGKGAEFYACSRQHSRSSDQPIVGTPHHQGDEHGVADLGKALRGKNALIEGGVDQNADSGGRVGDHQPEGDATQDVKMGWRNIGRDGLEASDLGHEQGNGDGEGDAHEYELNRIRDRHGPKPAPEGVDERDTPKK